MEELKEKIKAFWKAPKKSGFLVVIGLVGILLIAGSGWGKTQPKDQNSNPASISDQEYCLALEEKVAALVGALTGDESCIVGVTLENGNSYVYADQNTVDRDQSEDKAKDAVTVKESHKSEQQYIIVEDESGAQTALIVTEKKPAVRGVAIVAAGINPAIEEEILEAVSSMLGVGEHKISITGKIGS